MKNMMLVAGMIATMASFAQAQTTDLRPGIAVLPFTNGAMQPELAPLSKGFQGMLNAELASNTRLRVVEREHLQRIIEEQRLGASGQLDPATLVKVGKIVGARYMIYGGYITDPSRTMVITIIAFDTETSEQIFADNSVKGKVDNLLELIAKASVVANTRLNLPQLPPGSPAAREAAAKTEHNKKMPHSAVVLYSRAIAAQDAGNKAEAITLYKQVVDKFPYPPAEEALVKLGAK
jgi:TolB-like protein